MESWCRRGDLRVFSASAASSRAGCGTMSPAQPPSVLRSGGLQAPRGRRASQVCCPPLMGAGRAGVIAALTQRQPGKPLPAPNKLLSSPPTHPPPPLRTGRSDCPRAEGRLPPRPRPSRLLRRVSAPARPGARRARPVPGPGRTGSRCSAQRRLHPRVWSQARRGPAGGGGGDGGGILRLPRPPPRPPSSLLLHRLRAPLTGPSAWPRGASPGRLGQRRAFSGVGRGTGDTSARAPGPLGRGLGPRAPQPGAPEESSSRRRWSLTERPPARPASRAQSSSSSGGGGYRAERAAGAAVRAPPPQSRPPLGCRPPPALPHPSSSRPPAPRAALPAPAPGATPATSDRDTSSAAGSCANPSNPWGEPHPHPGFGKTGGRGCTSFRTLLPTPAPRGRSPRASCLSTPPPPPTPPPGWSSGPVWALISSTLSPTSATRRGVGRGRGGRPEPRTGANHFSGARTLRHTPSDPPPPASLPLLLRCGDKSFAPAPCTFEQG